MKFEKHLYAILYPNPSLVASQISPEHFARHYRAGSTRHYSGKVLFASIDINFRNPYFNIDDRMEELIAHEDGRPKATKFISSYRVLEHLDIDAVLNLYLTTPEGHCLELAPAEYDIKAASGGFRVFTEINPLRMVVLTDYNFVEFGRRVTSPDYPKGAPKLFYTQLDIDLDEFVKEFQKSSIVYPPIPNLVPSKLIDAIQVMKAKKKKHTKGLLLDCPLDVIPYRMIKYGFMIASQDQMKYFPMPAAEEIERINYKFWKSM